MDLTNGTLLIGSSVESYSLFYDGTNLNLGGQIQFVEGGKVVAYINGQKFNITEGVILDSLVVGNHQLEKYGDGTICRWVGEA